MRFNGFTPSVEAIHVRKPSVGKALSSAVLQLNPYTWG